MGLLLLFRDPNASQPVAHEATAPPGSTPPAAFHPMSWQRLGQQDFRFKAIRPDLGPPRDVTDLLERVEWRDEGNEWNLNTIPVLRGSLEFRTHDPDVPHRNFEIRDGHSFRCDTRWGDDWMPLWEMRITKPPERNVNDGTTSVELADDLQIASLSQGYFRYKAGKKTRVRGWRYDEIVRDICERYRIPVGDLLRGTRRIMSFHPTGQPISPLEAIRQVTLLEQEWTGAPMVIAWRPRRQGDFGLRISNMRRNSILYRFAKEIREATVSPVRQSRLATAVVVSGSTKGKKGKRKKFGPVRKVDPVAVKRYGYIERRVNIPGDVDGRSELERRAKSELANYLKPIRVVSNFQHPGVPLIRRGDTVRIALPEDGFVGDSEVMYVTTVAHTLEPEDYTMTLDMTWRDPLDPDKLRAAREKAMRLRKRRKNGAMTGKESSGGSGSAGAVGNGLTYPLAIHGTDLGGVAAHHLRPFGNWQSDNAVDIGCPLGTNVYAVDDGEIVKLGGHWDGTGLSNPNGFNVTLKTNNNEWFYTHMKYRAPMQVGDKIRAGAYLGESGAANGVKHLHIGSMNGDPEALLRV